MHIVSVPTMWQPVNTCLHACHVPVWLQGGIGMPLCTPTVSQSSHTAVWAGLFAHVPWSRDNMWLHRRACSHWVRVPVLLHGDGSLPVHIVLSPDNTGSLLHHAMPSTAAEQRGPLCSQDCHTPGSMHGNSRTPFHTCDVPHRYHMVVPAPLNACLLCSRDTMRQPEHTRLHSCHSLVLSCGGLVKHVCILVLSHSHRWKAVHTFFSFFFAPMLCPRSNT